MTVRTMMAAALATAGITAAGEAVAGLLRAGLRLEDYPILVCWSEPFADFTRYLPISSGLL